MALKAVDQQRTLLVTGAAGFIGSNFVLNRIAEGDTIIALDLLTYSGNRLNLDSVAGHCRFRFVQGDIGDGELIRPLLQEYRPHAIVHFAAESHVDRSILDPGAFIRTNVWGTFTLLEQARVFWNDLSEGERTQFRFLHVSTDEVYGSLTPEAPAFSEATAYAPNSPYAASKAGSDHLVRAYFHTYGFPTLTTNCSNNYGPFQFPEKLIPLMILNGLEGKPLPVYGDGRNVRDWLFVGDHCAAIGVVLEKGQPGQTYNIGGNSERSNLQVVYKLCDLLDELSPDPAVGNRRQLVQFVPDRPGHDRRYAIDASKIARELGWSPRVSFEDGLRRTVKWYLKSENWIQTIRTGAYRQWIQQNYEQRTRS